MKTLSEILLDVASQARDGVVSLGQVIQGLGPQGPAALIATLSLPFVLPVQIPGLSVPFGLILLVVGAQLGWREKLWCPQWLENRTVSKDTIIKMSGWIAKAEKTMQRYIRQRWGFLGDDKWIDRLVGITVMACSLVFAIPIPLPFVNMLAAIPMVVMGLAMLAKDGVLLLIGMGLAGGGLLGVIGLVVAAWTELTQLFS